MEPLLLDIPEEIFTDRLLIRTARAGDGPMIHTAASETHEQLRQWMPWAAGELKVEEFELFARRAIAGFASRTQFHLLLMLRTTNEFVGTCGFHKINWSVPACEIGYWLRQSQQGCGLMNEAVIRVTQFAFSLGIRRVELRCDARNDRSVRVAERAGFQLEGILRSDSRGTDANLRDTKIFSRLAAEAGL